MDLKNVQPLFDNLIPYALARIKELDGEMGLSRFSQHRI